MLLAATPLGVPGAWAGTLPTTNASDGHYAYYSAINGYYADIYRTDGTAGGTKKLGSVYQAVAEPPSNFTLINGQLFFLGSETDSSGRELYAVDRVNDQVVKLSNFSTSAVTGEWMDDIVALNGKAYVRGWSPTTGYELYVSDGTTAGTKLLYEAVPGSGNGVVSLGGANGMLFFAAQTSPGNWSIYKSDGTTAGTQLLTTIAGTSNRPQGFVGVAGGRTVFSIEQLVGIYYQNVLWVTDGTPAGTHSLNQTGGWKFVSTGTYAAYSGLHDSAGDGYSDIYVTDGTAEGFHHLSGAYQLPDGARYPLVPVGNTICWANYVGGAVGLQSLAADGTVTQLTDSAEQVNAVDNGAWAYFAGTYFSLANAVGVTDGTYGGTDLLAVPGSIQYELPTHFARTANGVVFSYDDQLFVLPNSAQPLPSVSGYLFRDRNRNGVRDDPSEDRETHAVLSPNVPVNADGSYTLRWAPVGSFTISVSSPDAYVRPTTPTSRTYALAEGQDVTGADFGFERVTVVSGTVRLDTNLDDVASSGEPGVAGRTVFADLDRDGVVDAGEPTAVSAANGTYSLDVRAIGQILVRVAPESGWYVSAPVAPGYEITTTVDGGLVTGKDFGVTQTPPRNYIGYTLFDDANRNGVKDGTEPTRSGGFVWVDLDDDGVFDAGEPSSTSASTTLRLPGPGTYHVRYHGPAGWTNTIPDPLVTLAPGERLFGLQLGTSVPVPSGGTLAGIAFTDSNGNGVRDGAEPANAGATIYLDLDHDFSPDPGEPSIITDSLGRFALVNLPAGSYDVRQVMIGTTHEQTTPPPGDPISVTLADGEQRTDLLFGERTLTSSNLGSITATYFEDLNANGVKDAGEPSFTQAGTNAYLDFNNNGVFDGGSELSVSAGNGFSFTNIAAGRYRIRLQPPAGQTFVPSTYDPADGLIVQQAHQQATTLEIGFYRPVVQVTSAAFDGQSSPKRVRLGLSGVWNMSAVTSGVNVTGPGGASVSIGSFTWSNADSNLDVNLSSTTLPDGDYRLTIPGQNLAGSSGLPVPSDFVFDFHVGLPSWVLPGSAATWDSTAKLLTVSGAATITADPALSGVMVNASGAAASLTIAAGDGSVVTLGSLQLSSGAVLTLAAHASGAAPRTLVLGGAPLIDAGSKLDLANNVLIVRAAGSFAAVQTAVATGFHGGAWDGLGGITSSAAAADANGLTALAVVDNADFGVTDFAGVSGLTPADVIVKYTYYGDADLDGRITLDDFSQFLNGYQTQSAATNNWLNGDFDYDGKVTLDDFSQFLDGYQNQGARL